MPECEWRDPVALPGAPQGGRAGRRGVRQSRLCADRGDHGDRRFRLAGVRPRARRRRRGGTALAAAGGRRHGRGRARASRGHRFGARAPRARSRCRRSARAADPRRPTRRGPASSSAAYSAARGVARYNRSWHWGLRRARSPIGRRRGRVRGPDRDRGGTRRVREIAAVDGVDVLFVGPADLSHMRLGSTARPTIPACSTESQRWPTAAREHGKAAGMLVGTTSSRRAPIVTSASLSSAAGPTAVCWPSAPGDREPAARAGGAGDAWPTADRRATEGR